jgi:glycosyltransferase involved in cell wall biosynthesis
VPALERVGLRIHRHFHRRVRKLQLLPLYRRLLARPGRILVTTAGRIDLLTLGWAARGAIPPHKAYLYFHWLRLKPGKEAFLRRFARAQPNVVVLGTTALVAEQLRELGFRNARLVPYPATLQAEPAGTMPAFRHVLFAGAARMDKGFRHVVDLVARLRDAQETLPVSVQISADHYAKSDARTRAEIDRLRGIGYPHLEVRPDTMSAADYARFFAGGICLQPYERSDFADRASGVTLDALVAGCPVVTVSRTWMARLIERFDAGVVVEEPTPEALHDAVRRTVGDYERFQRNARAGGERLRAEMSCAPLIELLRSREG